jgi:hypothetical protein
VHLGKYNVKFPDIFFIDWHCTPLTNQLSELFSQLVIILISLYPNTTRLLQPLEVATSRPLKLGWKTAVLDRHKQNSNRILNREWFAPAVQKYSLVCSAVRGFRACDVYSWNPKNTDFLECLGKKTKHRWTIQKP